MEKMNKYQDLLWELDDIKKTISASYAREKEIFEIIKKDKDKTIEAARRGDYSGS